MMGGHGLAENSPVPQNQQQQRTLTKNLAKVKLNKIYESRIHPMNSQQ